jgi:antitoxin ParD1/3/4/toxin ParE1/3/4
MSRYILTVEAQQDLREIRDYLTVEGGPRVARYVVGAFIVAFRRLARTPGIGHRRADLAADEELLFWPVFSYLIVYRCSRGSLAVVAVVHGRRDVAQALQARSL